MKRKCRVWWPANLLPSRQSQSSVFLFGWILPSSLSLDIIVAFSCNEALLSTVGSDLQAICHKINGKMPVVLQDKCVLSTLGYLAADSSSNGQSARVGTSKQTRSNYLHNDSGLGTIQNKPKDRHGQQICGCHKGDGLLEQCKQASTKRNWIQLEYTSSAFSGRKFGWVPKLHHIHWDGQVVTHLDLHVLIYEIPKFGSHHFSLGFSAISEQTRTPLRKPKWVEGLHQNQPLFDLDTVILAINCGTAARSFFQELVFPDRSNMWLRIEYMFVLLTWKALAISVACLSTFVYSILQFLQFLGGCGLYSCGQILSAKLFNHTWKNIRARCCQILYWPIFLRNSAVRSGSCVEYAEKASLRYHSMWSAVVVDTLLGNLLGIALLIHAESVCLWISAIANDITNYWLRISCARLMGNPAGFKLNTELARVLGMISLNSIQIWSTIWVLFGSLLIYIIKGVAMSGIVFGFTTFTALTRDLISIVMLHVSTLHWLISLLYSQQIQAIAAFWRLFRGQKWNPLRQRLDSYDYTVEQHIVGSLVFTPLLLLLPTTSAFYIFFTIMNSTINVICMLVEVLMSVIHAIPYNKVFLWLVSPSRFPGGVWVEILSFERHAIDYSEIGCLWNVSLETPQKRISKASSRSNVLTSYLHSYSSNAEQVFRPHFKYLCSAISRSSVSSSAYGLFSGRSLPFLYNIPTAPGVGLPPKMPWILIPCKDYWILCRDAVFSCRPDYKRH